MSPHSSIMEKGAVNNNLKTFDNMLKMSVLIEKYQWSNFQMKLCIC